MPATQPLPKPEYALLPGKDGEGNPVFSVLLKRTYDIVPGAMAARADADRPLLKIDEYWDLGDPETAAVKYESDSAPFKEKTDLVFIGKAYAPEGKPIPYMDVGIQLDGAGRKLIRVIGDRKCAFRPGLPPLFTEPQSFTEMEIRYENAYGGTDARSNPDMPFPYPRNPLGKGLALKNVREAVHGLALPNLEDPQDLLTPERVALNEPEGWRLQPMPQGLGWYPRTCYPRAFFAGSVPPYILPGSLTKEEHLGLVPKNHIALARGLKFPSFHPLFSNGASPGLAFPRLSGGETVRLRGLTRGGQLQFRLPEEKPYFAVDFGMGPKTPDPLIDTVCIRGEDMQVDLVWRGSVPYPGLDWLPEMKKLEVEAA
jgi:hypothetical protein